MAVITRWSYKRGGRKAGSHVSGSFSNDDCKDNEYVRKTISLLRKTTSLHVHHAFLYISLLLLHGYYVKMPNFMFYQGRKQARTKFSFSFLTWVRSPKKSNSEKFACIRHFQRIAVNATKFEKTQIHFKSDVSAAVAVVDDKSPYYFNPWTPKRVQFINSLEKY